MNKCHPCRLKTRMAFGSMLLLQGFGLAFPVYFLNSPVVEILTFAEGKKSRSGQKEWKMSVPGCHLLEFGIPVLSKLSDKCLLYKFVNGNL